MMVPTRADRKPEEAAGGGDDGASDENEEDGENAHESAPPGLQGPPGGAAASMYPFGAAGGAAPQMCGGAPGFHQGQYYGAGMGMWWSSQMYHQHMASTGMYDYDPAAYGFHGGMDYYAAAAASCAAPGAWSPHCYPPGPTGKASRRGKPGVVESQQAEVTPLCNHGMQGEAVVLTDETVLPSVFDHARTADGSKYLVAMVKGGRAIEEICRQLLPEAVRLAKDPHASNVLVKVLAYPKDMSIREDSKLNQQEREAFDSMRHEAHAAPPEPVVAAKRELATALLQHVHVLATDTEGCWVLEEAFENVEDRDLLSRSISSLRTNVVKLIKDKHANYVIQRILHRFPLECIGFMILEIEDKVDDIAQHIYGCRALQRLLERNDCGDRLDRILERIMVDIDPLIKHRYGNYVVQHILEKGRVQDQERIFIVVLGNLVEFSIGKCSINVVEKCLKIAYGEKPGDRPNSKMQHLGAELVHRLIVGNQGDPCAVSPIHRMMDDRYGNYIVQRLIDWSRDADKEALFSILERETGRLSKSKDGNRVLEYYKKRQ